MAIEIKYSEKLAGNVEAQNVRLKCSWADVDVLDVQTESIKRILLTVTKPTLAYTPYKVTRYKSIFNEKDSNIGIATGRYVDIAGDRYIEIYTVPDPNLSAAVISREQLMTLRANDPLNKGKEGEARRELMTNMINGVGYDKNKYILTYTIPATAFVRLSSIVLVDSNNNTFDKGDIEKDSSTTIKENKESNAWWLALGLFALNNL